MNPRGYSKNRPQNRRNLRRGVTGALILFGLLMVLADRQQDAMLKSGRLSADDTSARIMGVLAMPVRGIEGLFQNADARARAFEENKILKQEVERLRMAENRAHDLEMRISIFENMLGLETSSDVPITRIAARAVGENDGPFVHSALINAGSEKGVARGHAVMTVDGLYGHVVRAGKASARVLLLEDLSSRISVQSQRSQSRAIMIGDNAARPKLEYISPEAEWAVGDRVVTSGDDGVLPSGLPIGIVAAGLDQNLTVQLFTSGKPVDWVWVYPFDRTPVPEMSEEIPAETPVENTPDTGVAAPVNPEPANVEQP